MIDWTAFNWEAFATLVTGFFAALAVLIIGLGQIRIGLVQADIQTKQAGISHRQTQLMERQTRLAEIDQRIVLFDRRMEIYAAFNNYLLAFVQEAAPPSADLHREMISALLKARFLFQDEVYRRLEVIEKRASKFGFLHRKMKRDYDARGYYEAGDSDREAEDINWMFDTFRTLGDVFGDELKLSHAEVDPVEG